MNIFVIPSWYPSAAHPGAGIFFREQAELYAHQFPQDQVGIVHWGQNDERLLLTKADFLNIPAKWFKGRQIQLDKRTLGPNLTEYFRPAFTWSRSVRSGNIRQIVAQCRRACSYFTNQHGAPDVLHAHVGFPGGYIAWKLSEMLGIPFVITEHMGPFPFPSFQTNGDMVSSWLLEPLKQAGMVLAVSTHLQEQMQPHGITSRVFHNFIDDDVFRPAQAAADEGKKRLLHIGRLAPEKRQADLLKALTFLPATLDYELELIGDGPLRQDIANWVQEYGLESRVRLAGQQSRSAVQASLQRAEVLILSSDYENFPVSILEALACGKPVVATRCGGPEEMIGPVNGLLANPRDPQDLAEKIADLITHLDQYDPQTIRADFERRFGAIQSMERLRKIYQEIVNDAPTRPVHF